MWRPDVARRRPVGEILEKKKPAAMFARARYSLDDATLPVICPTSQPVFGMLRLRRYPAQDTDVSWIDCAIGLRLRSDPQGGFPRSEAILEPSRIAGRRQIVAGANGTAGAPVSNTDGWRGSRGALPAGVEAHLPKRLSKALSGFSRRRSKPGTEIERVSPVDGSCAIRRSKISGVAVPGPIRPACFNAPAAKELLFWEYGRYS